MTRGHRRLHRLIWPVLIFAVGVAFVMALALRPPAEGTAASAPQELSR